jgi:hypothetical protein
MQMSRFVLVAAAAEDSALVSVVQNATRPFMDPAAAIAAGYGPFLGCVSGTQEGAMGVHYVSSDLVFDGKLEPDRPESLMYEMRDGRRSSTGTRKRPATASHQIRKSTRVA